MPTERLQNMSYTINRIIPATTLDAAEDRVRAALSAAGFGVLTEIDVQVTMKQKLGEDMLGYRILGACNPKMAHEAPANQRPNGLLVRISR